MNGRANDCTYIVILNWNGWRDTVECLSSVLTLTDAHYRIVVCDNGSTDGSVAAIRNWADGSLESRPRPSPALAHLAPSPLQSVPMLNLRLRDIADAPLAGDAQLILIENEANLGFAAGNNPGIRYALAQPDMSHVWLLNNDTLVEPDTLSRDRKSVV